MLASTDSAFQAALEKEKLAIRQALPHASDALLAQAWTEREAQLRNEFGIYHQVDTSRQHAVPRSLSYGGPIDSRQYLCGNLTRPLDRDENKSTHSAPAEMIDIDSYSTFSSPVETSYGSDAYNTGLHLEWDDAFPTSYTLSPDNGSGTHNTSPSNTPALRVYDDPNEFVQTLSSPFNIRASQSTSPFAALAKLDSDQPTLYRSQLGYDSPSESHSGSNTPRSIELTPCSTQTSNMSREDSALSTSFKSVPFDMLRLNSSVPVSAHFDVCFSREDPLVFPCDVKSESFISQFPILGSGGDTLLSSTLSASYGVTAPYSQSISQSDLEGEMKRSTSFQSTNSGSSAQSRSSQRKQEILASSNRPIAPKGASDAESTMSRSSSQHKMVRMVSQDDSSKDVAQISKAPYIRPQHPKIICPHCNEYPDGFRGEHELRRHVDRKHAKVKKVWVTIDSSPDKTFLANCKQCRNQKQYGAYYNAAAHLRRAHFHPRNRGRKRKHDSEKRGGKGGGDDPPMDLLKQNWMKEIEVIVSDSDLGSTNSSKAVTEDSRQEASSSRNIPYNFTQSHAMGNGDLPVPMSHLPQQQQLPANQMPLPSTPSMLSQPLAASQQLHNSIEPAVYPTFDASQLNDFSFKYPYTNQSFTSTFDFNPNESYDPFIFDPSQQ